MDEHLGVVNDTKLNVLVKGAGPPVLLLHGFPNSLHLWRHQVPALLEAGYRVIVPDHRGYGRSGAPVGKNNDTAEKIIADALALLDVFGIQQKIRLIGHDWGATIGWLLAINHPERIKRFAALSVQKVQLPTMGIWSSRDVALSEKQMLNSAHWVNSSWRYERIEKASRWMMLDKPEELNALLLDWLAADGLRHDPKPTQERIDSDA